MERESKLESKFEMGPDAREVISLFQKAKETSDETERLKLLEEFLLKLVRLIQQPVPLGSSIAELQSLPRVLVTGERRSLGDDTIFLGGGTSGQRIFLKDWITIYNDSTKAERLGKDALKEYFGEKEITLKSQDGQPRWMVYYKPEDSDRKFGERYWKRFVEIFGDEIVDLFQE